MNVRKREKRTKKEFTRETELKEKLIAIVFLTFRSVSFSFFENIFLRKTHGISVKIDERVSESPFDV